MKATNLCVKCGNEKIVKVEGTIWSQDKHIPIDWALNLPLDRYICLNCGYTEEYVVTDNSNFRKLSRKKIYKADPNTDYHFV